MESRAPGTYLRFLRRTSGLSLRELARILGSVSPNDISRHERSVSPPGLIAAFAYQEFFQKSVAEIFPGLYETVASSVRQRLAAFEDELNDSDAKGRAAERIARRLEWLSERRESDNQMNRDATAHI